MYGCSKRNILFYCRKVETNMTLREQLEKVDKDLEKLEGKKKTLLEKRKQLLIDIELEDAKRKANENQEVMKIIRENYGDVTEENLEAFRQFMQMQSEEKPILFSDDPQP